MARCIWYISKYLLTPVGSAPGSRGYVIMREIARLGGGLVEAYPEDTQGKKVSPTFLHAGTLGMYEAAGFAKQRQIGKNKYVVTRRVRKAS